MPMSEAHIRASRKYNEKAYDRINFYVAKGKKVDLQTHAEGLKESLNGFVNRAIEEALERDNTDIKQPKVPEQTKSIKVTRKGKSQPTEEHENLNLFLNVNDVDDLLEHLEKHTNSESPSSFIKRAVERLIESENAVSEAKKSVNENGYRIVEPQDIRRI